MVNLGSLCPCFGKILYFPDSGNSSLAFQFGISLGSKVSPPASDFRDMLIIEA